jgi:hypothetical protein
MRASCFSRGEALGLPSELLGKRLEGDLAVERRVAGAVHLAHAAGPEPGDNLVWADARSGWEHDGPTGMKRSRL